MTIAQINAQVNHNVVKRERAKKRKAKNSVLRAAREFTRAVAVLAAFA